MPMAKPRPLVAARAARAIQRGRVIAAAAADGVLRAEAGGGDLKRGAHVVVKAAHQAPIFLIRDAAESELALEFGVMLSASVAKMVERCAAAFL